MNVGITGTTQRISPLIVGKKEENVWFGLSLTNVQK
jgi:hypothetical protein